jgi:hypothetical protein
VSTIALTLNPRSHALPLTQGARAHVAGLALGARRQAVPLHTAFVRSTTGRIFNSRFSSRFKTV